jgi:hypothetical protein
MIVKRLGAVVLAVILILGALLIRDRVLDDDNGSGDGPRADREIVCVEDLREACAALAEALEIDIRIEDAGDTLDALAALEDPSEAPIWITMRPFPEMVDDLRVTTRRESFEVAQTTVGSSPIALVADPDRSNTLTEYCGGTLQWSCVGEVAGEEWSVIGGNGSWETVRPAFAPIDSGIGLLGVADAVSGYFGGAPMVLDDLDFTRWASNLADAILTSSRPTRSAIATIQTRSSALDIAVGAEAELSDATSSELTLQYADPMIRADVVIAVPEGTSPPSGLTDELTLTLAAQGWDTPTNDPNPLPSARELVAIREVWKGFL